MKTINFKIIYNKNDDIYQEGYVEVPEDIEELPDWFYYDQNGFAQPRVFTNHDGIGLTQVGATTEQLNELDVFYKAVNDEVDFIDDAILTADEDENRTYVRENLTLIINEGAKIGCEIQKPINDRGDWIVELIPKFNGEKIYIADFMVEKGITFDPYSGCDEDFSIEDGHIYFEISKDWFEGDDEDRDDNLNMFIYPEIERIYKEYLISELGVFGIAYNFIERTFQESRDKRVFDNAYLNDWANQCEDDFESYSVEELDRMSSDDVLNIIKEDYQQEQENLEDLKKDEEARWEEEYGDL